MDNEILVSIHCLTYNHAPYIRECLDGFVMQKTNFRYEIVIHDDASTDGTADIIREYEKKYPDLFNAIYETENQYSKYNGDFYQIQNILQKAIKGKYVAYCEGDDYWIDPYKLQKQVDILESDPECSLVYTSYRRYIQDEDRFMDDVIVEKEGYLYEKMFSHYEEDKINVLTLTVCIRKDILEKLPPIPQDAFSGDIYLWMTASIMGTFRIVKDITSVYRILRESGCHFTEKSQIYKMFKDTGKLKIAMLEFHPINNIVIINSVKFRYLNHLIHYSLLTNNYEAYKDFYNEKKYFGKFKHRIKLFFYYFFREKHLFKCISWLYRVYNH
ncbi:glycosyltransferase [Pseudoprevotella muciniphila]|uniref:Glycosyltransferase n=1 Tax=Pseudoprevotella muciniphila TaxID=2133944 RepID=A0A5P8EA19_9BACT|nr:glycosyltransferase [Pseudoprevotella muciniphila]QFQ13793.1 glycosyltransferase [Pseudoprevotella muciniphila]